MATFEPVTMQRGGSQVVVRTRSEMVQREYDGWQVVGPAPTDPTTPPPTDGGSGSVDLSAYATKTYVGDQVSTRAAVGHSHGIGDIADLTVRTQKVDKATDAATPSTLAARDTAGTAAFTQVLIGATEPLLDGHAVPLAFVRQTLSGYVSRDYFDAQQALLIRRITDLEQGTYPEPDPGPSPATPGTFQALMGALL